MLGFKQARYLHIVRVELLLPLIRQAFGVLEHMGVRTYRAVESVSKVLDGPSPTRELHTIIIVRTV